MLEVQKRCCYLKNAPVDLEHLALKLCPIQIVICFSLWINLTTGLSVQLQQLYSYVGGTLLTNQFSLLLIDPCVLAIYQITTHEKHLRYCFWSVAIFWTASEVLAPWSQQQKVAKTIWKSLSLSNYSQKLPFFFVLMYVLYGDPRYFKFKQKYQQYGPCFQIVFPFLITIVQLSAFYYSKNQITFAVNHKKTPFCFHAKIISSCQISLINFGYI